MRPSTYVPISHERKSSADASTVATATIPSGTSAVWISVETTNARVTFDNSDPSAASAPSLVIPKDTSPQLFPVGAGCKIKHVSTAGAPSVLQLLYVR